MFQFDGKLYEVGKVGKSKSLACRTILCNDQEDSMYLVTITIPFLGYFSAISLLKRCSFLFFLEIREWLKSLRLHKYTKMLLEISYEELLQLSDETLEKKNVTMGARGKILKYISHIRDRPNTLKQCARDLTVSQSKNKNLTFLCVLIF